MTCRSAYINGTDFSCTDPAVTLADYVKGSSDRPSPSTLDMMSTLIAIDTMDETTLEMDAGGKVVRTSGNPTEVALLTFAYALGHNYQEIRLKTRGRSDKGELSEFLVEGKQIGFSSARKMMSWAVPTTEGGYRIYCKGASEVLIARCSYQLKKSSGGLDEAAEINDASSQVILGVAETYARRGMRTLALAYRELPGGVDFDAKSGSVLNADGTEAFEIETELTFVSLVGIEDPLRAEVPGAIENATRPG